MTAFDDFIKEINSCLFVHCLGEKLLLKTSKNNTLSGEFLSINPDNMTDILYHDDDICIKNRIDIDKSLEQNNIKPKQVNKHNSNASTLKNDVDGPEEILYFKIEDISLLQLKQVNSTSILN